jgi:hypothetical protein
MENRVVRGRTYAAIGTSGRSSPSRPTSRRPTGPRPGTDQYGFMPSTRTSTGPGRVRGRDVDQYSGHVENLPRTGSPAVPPSPHGVKGKRFYPEGYATARAEEPQSPRPRGRPGPWAGGLGVARLALPAGNTRHRLVRASGCRNRRRGAREVRGPGGAVRVRSVERSAASPDVPRGHGDPPQTEFDELFSGGVRGGALTDAPDFSALRGCRAQRG